MAKVTHAEVSNLVVSSAQRLAEKEGIRFDQTLMRIGRKYSATARIWHTTMREGDNASLSFSYEIDIRKTYAYFGIPHVCKIEDLVKK